MSPQSVNLNARIKALNVVLDDKADQTVIKKAFTASKGDLSAALESIKDKLPEETREATLEKVTLAHSLAEWFGDNVAVVKAVAEQPKSRRDLALNYNTDALAGLVDVRSLPANITGDTPEDKKKNFAAALHNKLFATETSAVLQRMVAAEEVPIADAGLRAGVVSFLNNQPNFNIRTTSVYAALRHPDAYKGIADEQRAGVVAHVKDLQRVQALSPVAEVVPLLMKANLTSAFRVAEIPESTFLAAHGKTLGEETARQVYTNAINAHIRNEQALIAMREAVRGTGLAIIDGKQSVETRMASMQLTADKQGVALNFDALFGNIDYCECEECTSVYSAASYFVDLLQFLRNNNLDPDNPNTGKSGIDGTPLEKLFRRRPDLGCLELTCENTNTVLPYVDLVNEVMESFVVHMGDYHASTSDPKQARLDAFNIEDETTKPLLAQPQHTNYDAYCILKNDVYPFTLPYHQPIDAIRIFLKYLDTSRYELQDKFRAASDEASDTVPTEQSAELSALHQIILDRALDAEFLRLTQEEYKILTKEAFWPKRYFEITKDTKYTDDEYRQNIGVKPVYGYYGYETEPSMLDTDEKKGEGLTFVKKQFLPRTGILYTDLVELLKAQCINPNHPQGKALTVLEGIRFSYRFLQTLVDTGSTDPKIRFARLIEYLEKPQPLLPQLDAMLHPDPCQQQDPGNSLESKDLRHWVYCDFERVGQLIVLESGEGPQLPIEGNLFKNGNPFQQVGIFSKDGTIVDENGTVIGSVTSDAQVVGIDGKPLVEKFGVKTLYVIDTRKAEWIYVFVRSDGMYIYSAEDMDSQKMKRVNWLPIQDTCDLDKVRLTHLNGTPVTGPEYDGMQRFIRLWRKMGWTIDETDKALNGLFVAPADGTSPQGAGSRHVGFDAFKDDCIDPETGEDCASSNTSGLSEAGCEISPEFLHQLVAVRKLLDLTGLPLPKLLTFWADISTAGEKSLYSRLFLTHNLLSIDKVFQADANGNYLTQSAKITDHIPVLMTALKLKADDVTAIIKLGELTDELTLSNVSSLYRHSLLAKALHVKVPDLPDVIKLFGDPFQSAAESLELFETWGKMEDAGFTFRQLAYLIHSLDDSLRPLAPAKRTILKLSKTLFDGLNSIDRDHPDVPEDMQDQATMELVRVKAALLFDQSVIEQIVGLLEGTTVYTTNAPANQTITIPEALAKKIKYSDPQDADSRATIQVTGILTEAERSQAIALSSHPEWVKAIERVGKQTLNFYNDVLFGIFLPVKDEAITKLLAGDISLPDDQQDSSLPDANTAPAKRFYFLKYFIPFLRTQLTRQFIVATLSGAVGLANDVTDILLSAVLVAGRPSQPAITALENIKTKPAGTTTGWKGYLIPSVDEAYTFVARNETRPAPLLLAGESIPFKYQQEDPSDIWSTDPTSFRLKRGNLYEFEVSDLPVDQIQWKTAASPRVIIPTSALLPDYSSVGTEEVLIKLNKAALLVNGFSLGADEVIYWQTHKSDFDASDFNTITLQHWKRLQAYTDLRDNLPKAESTLLDLFKWSSQPDDVAKLSEKIAAVTIWKKENIDKLLAPSHFDLDRPEAFRNEVNLVTLRKALQVADKIGMDIDRLFEWAKPSSKFWDCHKIAEDIRKAIRARFDQEDWEQVVKPLNDQLRENQKQALISYLLGQRELIDWDIVDTDSLFEFFLIDVQMDPCMETSRIKQAISSVQLFVQRCLLGLEEKYGVSNDVLDRDRWDWMQRYRVWEANRKVFLYPENWIEPQLRDDKSPFYKELESELLQKDINKQTIEDALKSYLFKVDEVANLKVVGLFIEQAFDEDGKPEVNEAGNPVYIKLHVFARTRNAPYFYFYRIFNMKEQNWYAWEKVQVDIPSYDVANDDGRITTNGSYLTPVVWNKRLLIFFPQLVKKTETTQSDDAYGYTSKEKDQNNNETGATVTRVPINKPRERWEIKLGWSEYRNGKWTQKQISTDAIYHEPASDNIYKIYDNNLYTFAPNIVANPSMVIIDIFFQFALLDGAFYPLERVGSFYFTGSQISTVRSDEVWTTDNKIGDYLVRTEFHYHVKNNSAQIYSLQASERNFHPFIDREPYLEEPYYSDTQKSLVVVKYNSELNFYHPFVHELLGKLTSGDLNDFFSFYRDLGIKPREEKDDAFGSDVDAKYHELKRSYSLYNWEAAFHAPMQLVDRLLKAQQFEQAIKMCHYVFNPLAKGADDKRFWQFLPFKEIKGENVLETLFMGLQPNTPDASDGPINEWRNKPFQPHVVARKRPSAYMKWVVMKYIEILIAWGDYLFRQDTIESLNQATQLYVLAAHIYGPRGQRIPKRGKIQPQTYNSLLDKWDAFGNAMVELELAFPYSNQTPFPIGTNNGTVGLANVFGFATTLYFCIPDNPKLRELRNTIDDRLFKIRHCENIEGVFRKLPLFEPPIDPSLLVQAAAQGLSLSSVLNDLNSPMPNYRFYYLLQKALELCSELKALGNTFLSLKEKGDGEALSQLRARHESSIHNLVMEVKKLQLEEANKSLEALQQSRKGPVYRLQYFLKLIGEDLGKVPNDTSDFSELPNQIEQPVEESGLKLIQYEKEDMERAGEAADFTRWSGISETLAGIFHLIPNFGTDVKPFGVGAGFFWGGTFLGSAAQAVAKGLQVRAGDLSYQSTSAGKKGGFLRALQDRVMQANTAGFEIKNIDKQILTQQIRINVANLEIANQQKQIDNAQEVEEFLRNKYTNQELYVWMEGQIRALYYQAYTLAYELAKKAEKVFKFERGLTTSNFIQFGYWDAAYDGLLSGEKLYIALKQLEAAYQEKRGYDYEISKPISLRQIDPMALLQLRELGNCEFELPEVLFDMDRPGDYKRRIKSVALTIPCVVGPYTSLNCTLRLLGHKFRLSSIAKDKSDYLEKMDETDDRFSTTNVPLTAIAVSTGQNDSGMFELNFRDERYIPFEGAGVISKWQLEIPGEFQQFDYDTISDVILNIRYTSVDGGDKLKKSAAGSVQDYINAVTELSEREGLFAVFDLVHDFPSEWHKAMNPAADATERLMALNSLNDRLPVFTKGRELAKIQTTEIYLLTTAALPAASITLSQGNADLAFTEGTDVGAMKSRVSKDIDNFSVNNWQVKIQDKTTKIEKLWMVVRYKLL